MQVKRFDVGTIGKVSKTTQGFLKIPGVCTRTGVFTYRDGAGSVRRELRHPDDVFDPASLETLKHCVVTLHHPPEMVTPENASKYMKGYTTEKIEVSRDLIESDLIISNPEAIKAIEENGMREISAGYNADLLEETGTYNGAEYDCRQTNIRYNHVALVDKGRAGPEVRLRLDSSDAIMDDFKGVNMDYEKKDSSEEMMDMMKSIRDRMDMMNSDVEKMKMDMYSEKEEMKDAVDLSQSVSSSVPDTEMAPDGTSVTSKVSATDTKGPARAAGHADKDMDFSAPQGTSKGGTQMAPDEQLAKTIEERDMYKDKFDMAQAKLDAMSNESENKAQKYDSADINQIVARRMRLVKKAEMIVEPKVAERFDSMSDEQVMIEAIKATSPSFDSRDKSKVYLEARFDSVSENVSTARNLSIGKRMNDISKFDSVEDPDTARAKRLADDKQAWKAPLSSSKRN